MIKDNDDNYVEEPIHIWFGLTYANYLTIPRSVMQIMPFTWQKKMVALLDQLDETIDWLPAEGRYYCYLRDAKGKFQQDPLNNYRHGNTEADKLYKKVI